MFAGYNCNNYSYGCCQGSGNGTGVGYALILVLFILLVIIGSCSFANNGGF